MEWISVKERLPETSQKVLVTDGEDLDIMRYFGEYKGSPDWDHGTLDVTHWMPIPAPPEVK